MLIMIIAVDFDGTIVENKYPSIGIEKPFATQTLRTLIEENNRLILWTLRKGILLHEAIEWCRKRKVEFYAINQNDPNEEDEIYNKGVRKINADIFIDDRNIGGLPDWGEIYRMIQGRLSYEELYRENQKGSKQKKEKHWKLFKL